MAEPNLTELVATTLRNRSGTTADNISKGNALLSRMSQGGRVKPAAGGRTIIQELLYAENETFMWYSGYEALDISPQQVIDAAEYPWKQAAAVVTWSGLETRIQNASKEQVISLMETRMRAAEISMRNQVSIGLYSDGTGANGKQLTGIQSQVADDPTTGVVGGINRANFTFWRNQTSGSQAQVFSSTALLESEMRDMWIECTRGPDHPDLIVCDKNAYNAFWASLTPIQRVTESNEAVRGFNSLKFVTADVVYDGDSGIPADHMYFLNTDYIFFRPHTETNFVPLDKRHSTNQDAELVPMVMAGNLTMENASLQGVVFA